MNIYNLLPDPSDDQPSLSKSFKELHERHLDEFPNWSPLATRRKLIASFWLKTILNHYGFLIIAGALLVLFFTNIHSLRFVLSSMAFASALIFLVLFLTIINDAIAGNK